jgi:hypothetical protein
MKLSCVTAIAPYRDWELRSRVPPKSWLAPWILSSDTNGHPAQLGVKQFKKKKKPPAFYDDLDLN